MKKISLAGTSVLFFFLSCNNNSSTEQVSDTAIHPTMTGVDTAATNNTAPLTKEDSLFVMQAAAAGVMEVELGNTAQQNAQSERVKSFGRMMVDDHSQANNELKSWASGRGIVLIDSLPADIRKHVDAMKKMTGKAFDNHYMGMMVKDHTQDVSKFEKAATTVKDQELQNWITKTLPVLKRHLDSAQAINKSK